jgi:hypothetical protein
MSYSKFEEAKFIYSDWVALFFHFYNEKYNHLMITVIFHHHFHSTLKESRIYFHWINPELYLLVE